MVDFAKSVTVIIHISQAPKVFYTEINIVFSINLDQTFFHLLMADISMQDLGIKIAPA